MTDPEHAPDDPFAATRMSLGDHIEELRRYLLRALLGLGVGLVAGFFLGPWVMEIIAAPVEKALLKFYQRRIDRLTQRLAEGDAELVRADEPREVEIQVSSRHLAALLGLPAPAAGADEWATLPARVRPVHWALSTAEAARLVGRPPTLAALGVAETFTVYFKVSMYCGVVLASPWILYQLWLFVASGLYPHEKRLVRVYLPLSVGLFLAGVALCEFFVLPTGVDYLLSFNEWFGIEPDLRLGEWLSFALLMPLVFGAAFQTPLVMVFLERVGLFSVNTYRRHRRMAIFLLAVLAAVISVTPDWINMLSLAVPLWGLYEVGILLCRWAPRPPAEEDEAEAGELLEV
jgi:sec-independent protein translocase protein TatC